MAGQVLTRTVQQDLSGGMFRSGAPELIPANGAFDLSNSLLDLRGGLYKRGGSSYRTTAFGTGGLRFLWDGWLAHGGQHTIVGSPTAWGKVVGGGVTSIGGTGLTQPGVPAVYEGVLYLPGGNTYDGETLGKYEPSPISEPSPYYAVVANRVLTVKGNRVYFSKIGKPAEVEATSYHTIPGGIEVTGLVGLRSSAAVFTTGGIWIIGNLAHNLVDEAGNVQQTLDLYSPDLILWGNAGIAAWEGALIVPTLEGVYLLSLGVTSEKADSFVPISAPIVDLYHEYVRAGYTLGQAAVYKNHYLLPIIASGEVFDVLVCRLDLPGRPWTHLEGNASKMAALATRIDAGPARIPELLGAEFAKTSRLQTLFYFEPNANNELDADGSTPLWDWVSRSYATGQLTPNLVARARLRYQLEGAAQPKITMLSSSESDVPPEGAAAWGAFSWGEGTWASSGEEAFEAAAGDAPPSLDGAVPHSWYPRKKRRYARFRFTCSQSTSQLAIHSLELFVRPDGRL